MKKRVEKKYFYFLIGMSFLILSILGIYAYGLSYLGHDANEILIMKNGFRMNLNEARDNNFFNYNNNPVSNIYTDFILQGHGADEIWVNVSGVKMTLQQALDRSSSEHEILCSGGSIENFILDSGEVGHLGSEIEILVDGNLKSLQQAIDEDYLCGCQDNYNQICGIDDCMNPGVYNCEGVCDAIQKEVGESCGTVSGRTCTIEGNCCLIECEPEVCGEIDDGCGGTLTCGILYAEIRCYDNDQYWYDSCGNQVRKARDCQFTECYRTSRNKYYPKCKEFEKNCYYSSTCSSNSCQVTGPELVIPC